MLFQLLWVCVCVSVWGGICQPNVGKYRSSCWDVFFSAVCRGFSWVCLFLGRQRECAAFSGAGHKHTACFVLLFRNILDRKWPLNWSWSLELTWPGVPTFCSISLFYGDEVLQWGCKSCVLQYYLEQYGSLSVSECVRNVTLPCYF